MEIDGASGQRMSWSSLFHLDLPGDLLSGEYELRMVVYDFETQAPTGRWVFGSRRLSWRACG